MSLYPCRKSPIGANMQFQSPQRIRIMQNIHPFRSSATLAVAVLMSACVAGTNTIRISSDPSGADVMSNGVSVGKTPVSVPSKFVFLSGDTTKLILYKEGYQSVERTVTNAELYERWKKSDCAGGSEYGGGYTYPIHIRLEPKSGTTRNSPQVIYRDRRVVVPVPVEKKPDWR